MRFTVECLAMFMTIDQYSAGRLFYLFACKLMQVADIFFLNIDICQLGLDQRKVNMLALEYAGTTGRKKPIILSHRMLPGLLEGQEKMAKSNPSGAIFMDDDAEQIKKKLKHAFCPPRIVEGNPCVSYAVYLVMPWLGFFQISRASKFGGDVKYDTAESLEKDYADGHLHPMDLKNALAKHLVDILKPIQHHLENDEEARKLRVEIDAHIAKLNRI